MLEILKKLNKDDERGVLIGRNALNFHHDASMKGKGLFKTDDFDLVCPSVKAANECRAILEATGFTKAQTTFAHDELGNVDIVLADPHFPSDTVVEEYFNLPCLRPLWDARENRDGVLIPGLDDLLQNKLLYLRENEGKDAESVGLYFELNQDRLDPMLQRIKRHENSEEREKMLYALYESVAENEPLKRKVEQAILADLE